MARGSTDHSDLGATSAVASTQARDRRVAGQGEDDRRLPRPRLRRRVVDRSHPRPAPERRRRPRQDQGRAVGAARRRRRQRLHAVLRGVPRQEAAHDQAQGPAQGRRRALPRHRRGPRGRGDRLAPAGGAQAEGAGAPDGVPRDHPQAIQEAVDNPRDLDLDLVEAQEARRILDRLYGYEVSPVLWKKVMSGLSAGRVQSVATRLVVDRERERMAFRVASYWDLEGTFDAGEKHAERMFPAKLHSRRRRPGRPRLGLRRLGELKSADKVAHLDRPRAEALAAALDDTDVRGALGRVQAVPPLALRAVPHHDAAAGGLAQARLRRLADDGGRAAAVRERLHHLHAHRLDHAVGVGGHRGADAGARAVRRGVPPRRAADLPVEGQERPGGARGDPPGRRDVPHPGADRPDRRRVPALRADLDAHRRLADEGRRRAGRSRSGSAAPRPPARTSCSPRPAG